MVFLRDVRDLASQEEAVKEIIKEFGQIDLVVANAGLGHFASVEDITPEQWQETIDTNLTGAFYSLKAGIEALKKSKGYYITISSLAGTNFFPNGSAYNASKFGFIYFLRNTAFKLIDCQVYTDHLASLGAEEIDRRVFLSYLNIS